MKILAINCGSSTLKFSVLDESANGTGLATELARGVVDRIGGEAVATLSLNGRECGAVRAVRDHGEAFGITLEVLRDAGSLTEIEAVGHRVVHGGVMFSQAVLINDDVLAAIEVASDLAPLHNRPAIAAIAAARAHFGEAIPMVATFDTAFYASLPDVATTYALPQELRERLDVRRFGFHGLAHRYMVERYAALRPDTTEPRLITLQLGNGCSVTASINGKPVDTSMGFTPLEGLIMGTRSGDLDPSIPLFLVAKEGLTIGEVESLLNTQSGLLGLSGRSNDMRELLAAARTGDRNSDLAVRAFSYRAGKYVGSYLAVLGGADAVIFGGGIGEHIPDIRAAICSGLAWAGLRLDAARNGRGLAADERISADGAAIEVWVVHVDEAVMIARDVVDCLREPWRELAT